MTFFPLDYRPSKDEVEVEVEMEDEVRLDPGRLRCYPDSLPMLNSWFIFP